MTYDMKSSDNDPIDGRCCHCGYSGEDERCPNSKDASHCGHWWDGPDDLFDLISDNDLASERGYDGDL